MRISHKYKFIFFANPKTGSETVRKILDPYSDIKSDFDYPKITTQNPFYSHMPPKEVKVLFQERELNFDKYYKFTLVRNPWSRLVSLYEMIYGYKLNSQVVFTPTSIKNNLFFTYKKLFSEKPDFKNWLLTIQNNNRGAEGKNGRGSREGFFTVRRNLPNNSWRIYGSYSIDNYIMDKSRNILVDKVIKLENIDRELITTLAKLNLPGVESIEIPKVNIRKHQSYIDYYDEESIKIVRKLYQYDIEHFNYQFGD